MTQPTIDFIQSAGIVVLSGGLFFLAFAVLRLRGWLINHEHMTTVMKCNDKYIYKGKIFDSFLDVILYFNTKDKESEP